MLTPRGWHGDHSVWKSRSDEQTRLAAIHGYFFINKTHDTRNYKKDRPSCAL